MIKRENDGLAPSPFTPDLLVEMLAVTYRGASSAFSADIPVEVVTVALFGSLRGLFSSFYSTWVLQTCHILTRLIISGMTV